MKLLQSGYGGCGLVIEAPLAQENKGCTRPREQVGQISGSRPVNDYKRV
jgi:hypothetical protein